jgi:hypothetical protein
MNSEPKWNLFLILPSLKVKKVNGIPNLFRTEYMQICDGSDPVLANLANNVGDLTMTRLSDRFASNHGKTYKPACLLIRVGAPIALISGKAITAFRNVCCAATVTFATRHAVIGEEGSRWDQLYSDHFAFWPEIALKDGSGVWKRAIVSGWTDEIDTSHGHPTQLIETPEPFDLSLDAILLERLLRVWRNVYENGAETSTALRLFRALEVAFHAARFPAGSIESSIYDVGVNVGLWVSAFEILCRGEKKVWKSHVFELLQGIEWEEGSPLREKRYSVPIGKGEIAVTFVEKVYDEIYAARNDFMHGNPVDYESLKLKCAPTGGRLYAYAPVLFNLALRAFLAKEFPSEPTQKERDRDAWFYFDEIERALRAAIGEPESPPEGISAGMVPPPAE